MRLDAHLGMDWTDLTAKPVNDGAGSFSPIQQLLVTSPLNTGRFVPLVVFRVTTVAPPFYRMVCGLAAAATGRTLVLTIA